jgi:hypothetical protein
MMHVIGTRLVILVLVSSNFAAGYYIYSNWDHLHGRPPSARAALTKKKVEPGPVGYNRGALKEAMVKYNSVFEECYNTFLHTEPAVAEGSVVVNWIIGKDGEVESPTVMKSELNDQSLHGCLTQHLQSLKFTPPKDQSEVAVAHKFNFKKRSPSEVVFESF